MAVVYRLIPINQLDAIGFGLRDTQNGHQVEDFFKHHSEKTKHKALSLLKLVQSSSKFKIHPNYSIAYEGKIIPNSHIGDLITFAVQSGFPKRETIPGLAELILFLEDIDVPTGILSPRLKSLLKSSSKKWQKVQMI